MVSLNESIEPLLTRWVPWWLNKFFWIIFRFKAIDTTSYIGDYCLLGSNSNITPKNNLMGWNRIWSIFVFLDAKCLFVFWNMNIRTYSHMFWRHYGRLWWLIQIIHASYNPHRRKIMLIKDVTFDETKFYE